jgi:cAMP and cAMP-inhibited cGMP 3',5'-cyclic phosphodiesterase 10
MININGICFCIYNRFDMECVIRFVLTVRKNYRNVPYHNWSHAFSVAHAMYTVIKRTKHRFTPNQVKFKK